MKKVLLVKITSMGDLIQMLPALTDAAAAIPGIQFDWLAEESFKEIPRLHPAVHEVITLPYRQWKKNKRLAIKNGEVTAFIKQLRSKNYDLVIDAQSNLKSALVSMFAKGKRYGLDKTSVREFGAHFAYHKQFIINRDQNHAQRMRQMMAMVLDYALPKTQADYGIIVNDLPTLDFALPERFIFIIPIASSASKLWPEPYWQEVVNSLVQTGYNVVIPWWSPAEKDRALRLQNAHPSVHLLPSLNLAQKARVLSQALAVISIDTGLAHMAAALNIPNVCLYGSSNPKHCGTLGRDQIHLSANQPACAPCGRNKCTYQGTSQYQPACMDVIKPKEVLDSFYKLL